MSEDQYCVIGHPIEHSQSPWIHTRFAELTGQSLRYDKRLVPIGELAPTLRALAGAGVRGCNVTVPFKFAAAALAQRLSERAALAGAANVLSFHEGCISADNTDGIGLVRDIEHNAAVALLGQRVLLLGAGGAGAGVLGPLLLARPASLTVANRTIERARALVERHRSLAMLQKTELFAQGLRAFQGTFDIVINATSSSLGSAGVPVSASVLKPGALAYDLMYGPPAEAFLRWAQNGGALARDGLGMLVEQAAEAFAIWRGVRAPSQQVLAELRTLLASPT